MGIPAPLHSVYRPRWYWRASALVYLALVIIFSFKTWWEVLFGATGPHPDATMISAIFFVAGLGFALHTFRASVRFTADAVEHWRIYGIEKLPLNKIRGRREYAARGGDKGRGATNLRLEPSDVTLPTLDFSKSYTFDDAFFKWFYSLTDLDAGDKVERNDKNSVSVQSVPGDHAPQHGKGHADDDDACAPGNDVPEA